MSFKTLRNALADAVTTAGMKTYPYEPQAFSTPGGLVYPGTPFVGPGDVFGTRLVRFDLYVLVEDGRDEQLDDLVSLVIGAVVDDYDIENVEMAPQFDNGVLSGARITLTTMVGKEEIY